MIGFTVNASSGVSFSDISCQRKLQRDRAHSTIRAKGAERGQPTGGQRESRGKTHPRAERRGCQTEILITREGKKLSNILLSFRELREKRSALLKSKTD